MIGSVAPAAGLWCACTNRCRRGLLALAAGVTQLLRVIVTRGTQGRNQMLQMKFSGAITRFGDALVKLNSVIAGVADPDSGAVPTLAHIATKATLFALKVHELQRSAVRCRRLPL